MSSKITLSVARLGGCGGCLNSIFDNLGTNDFLNSELNTEFEVINTQFINYQSDSHSDVTIIEGNIVNEDDLLKLQKILRNSEILIGVGSCTIFGGVFGLRELVGKYEYANGTSGERFYADVARGIYLRDLINFDYMASGCAVLPDKFIQIFKSIIYGTKIDYEETKYNLCYECDRAFSFNDFLNVYQNGTDSYFNIDIFSEIELKNYCESEKIDDKNCFLEQGIVCLGLITDKGCGAKCINQNIPCRGCLGCSQEILDKGAKLINSLATLISIDKIQVLINSIEASYQYNLPYRRFT